MALALGVPVATGRAAYEGEAGEGGVEATARRGRYAFLAEAAARLGCRVVATGHTADDRIETLLMHLLRGAGTGGLRGMLPAVPLTAILGAGAPPGITVVRPMLGVARRETESYCQSHGLDPIMDPSNRDPAYMRNRVRGELLPFLESFNPSVRSALLRTATVLEGDVALLEEVFEEAGRKVVIWREAGSAGLDGGELRLLAPALQRGLIQRLLRAFLPPERQPTLRDVERVRSLGPSGERRISLAGGVEAESTGGVLVLGRSGASETIPIFPQLQNVDKAAALHDELRLAAGWRLRASDEPASPEEPAWSWHGPLARAVALEVRSARPGERMEADGYDVPVRVADLLAAAGVPRMARRTWPVLTVDGQVTWIVGIRKGGSGAGTAAGRWITLDAPDDRFGRWRERARRSAPAA
jgi:tRNA(Ile)-lysidine synthase